MGRKRKEGNVGLEPHLYRHKSGFRYFEPGGHALYWPTLTLAEANEKAKELNAPIDAESVKFLFDEYYTFLETQTLNKPRTLKEKKWLVDFYTTKIGKYKLKRVTTLMLSTKFKQLTPNARQKHRSLWVGFFQWAISEGHVSDNPAAATMRPKNIERKKGRHTQEGYDQIYNHKDTPDFLKIAMELAVSSLQDLTVLVELRRDNYVDGHLKLTRYKVEGKSEANLSIPVTPGTRLHRAMVRALKHPVIGDTLLRRVPTRRRAGPGNTEILPRYLSKAFSKARLVSGAYSDMDSDKRPDFKALRSFGSKLYLDAGIPRSEVQKLMAHQSATMTKQYQEDGYEIIYVEARADLI